MKRSTKITLIVVDELMLYITISDSVAVQIQWERVLRNATFGACRKHLPCNTLIRQLAASLPDPRPVEPRDHSQHDGRERRGDEQTAEIEPQVGFPRSMCQPE